ncbi:type III secretion system cytoplasmic ring protein SctQ [Pseudomonas entomophila]|uniref:type III secretion system cytoplasmic ring protein SctQ n=1 Tax=Pseudomonas entomophila TaxID=312306 RepID=UPI0023D87979|nr:type III secretion system cytoplasmic ring protein SctQ [Pseudomonas entomophila]MDF0733072.1 type III secretion system cytoplasmic ring protein SctQ [Pseudomonas entomophila]
MPTEALAFAQALERHDPRWLPWQQRLHRPRQAWQGQFDGQPLHLDWRAGEGGEGRQHWWLALDGAPVRLSVPAQAIERLGLPASLNLPGLASALLLEQALLPLIEPLERLLALPLQVLDSTPAAVLAPLHLDLTLTVGGSALAVRLDSDAVGWSVLLDALDQHTVPAPHDLGALPLSLHADGGEAWLTLAELRSLLPGDVVMLDPWPDTQVCLRLGRQLLLRAQREGHRLHLLEHPKTLKEATMSEAGDSPLDSSLDELQLKLTCQVGSVELSLAQLRELGPGSVLELAPRLHEGVDLVINGRRVGQGQLVKIGDGLGVRLLSFAVS